MNGNKERKISNDLTKTLKAICRSVSELRSRLKTEVTFSNGNFDVR